MPLFWLRRPHVPLLALLLVLIALYPLIERSLLSRWLFNLLAILGVTFSLHRVHAPRRWTTGTGVLGVAALGLQAVHGSAAVPHADVAAALFQASFYFAAASLQVRYILRDTRATMDELFSAAVAFLLLSLGWASTYWCVAYFVPGSFAIAHTGGTGRPTWYELFYFSVTTLSTTGFGDVVPVSSAARSAAILEQLVGVLYVALVISRLAGFAGRHRAGGSGRSTGAETTD
jgi:hypothetical protein